MERCIQDILTVVWKETLVVRRSRLAIYASLFTGGIFAVRIMSLAATVTPVNAKRVLPMLLDQTFTWWAVSAGLMVFYILNGQMVSREKQTKSIEALLAAPLSLRAIWCGKSCFMWAVSVCAAWLVCAAAVITLIAAVPTSVGLPWPALPSYLFLFVLGPLLLLALIHLVTMAMLLSWNTILINAVLLAGWVAPFLKVRASRGATYHSFSWDDTTLAVIMLALLTAANCVLRRFLTTERVVLTQG